MAQTPGLTVVPHAADIAGRHGVGIAWSLPGNGGKTMIIFSPRTYAALGITTWGAAGQRGGEALLKLAIVDQAGSCPDQSPARRQAGRPGLSPGLPAPEPVQGPPLAGAEDGDVSVVWAQPQPCRASTARRPLAARTGMMRPRPPSHTAHSLNWRRRRQARSRWYPQRTRLATNTVIPLVN